MKILSNKKYEKSLKFAFEQGLLYADRTKYDINSSWKSYFNIAWNNMKDVIKNI